MPARIGPAGVWSNFDRLPGDEVVAFARQPKPPATTFWTQETAGRDPFALLGRLAGRTERIGLAVGIAVVYGRDRWRCAPARPTVHELSGGRMLLGLGSSHRDTVSEVRGHVPRTADGDAGLPCRLRGRAVPWPGAARPAAAGAGRPAAPHAGAGGSRHRRRLPLPGARVIRGGRPRPTGRSSRSGRQAAGRC